MVSFRKVLVSLDGSQLAERALVAIDLFLRAGADHVVLVRVLERDDDEAAEAAAYLNDVATRLSGRNFGVEISTPRGKPEDAILAEVKRLNVDVLAMATHGRSGLGRWLYGGVAEAVLEHAPVPVLLTRAWEPSTGVVTGETPQRVLVPLDGSPAGEAVLPVVAALAASPLDAELVLLRVVEPPHQMLTGWVPGVVYSDVGTESEQQEAAAYLNSVSDRLIREYGARASAIATDVRVGRSIDAILEAAGAHACTLVCMVTRAQTGIGRVIVGTVTDGVLRRGSNPLLLVRPS